MSTVTIIIPAKNEGEGMERIINSAKPFSDDIIVVDGNSKDGTKETCEKLGVTYLLDDGRGKGAAMAIGVQKAKYDDILFYDADGSHDEKDIPEFIRLLKETDVDMITASRRTGGSHDVNLSFGGLIRSAGCDFLTFLVNHRYNVTFTDVLYSFRAIRKKKFLELNLKEPGFGVEQEMVMNALHRKFKITEIPSREKMRGWGESKLGIWQGIYFIWMILIKFFRI
jgi:glycosyltransferase involved in cell wall biosynthesis